MDNLNYSDYAEKLIVADASPLIELDKLGKLEYLNRLFKEVYTTKTLGDEECINFTLPPWIKIQEPREYTKNIFMKIGLGKGGPKDDCCVQFP